MNKDRNYFSKFLFLVSIFIFAYVAYRSEIIWEGSNHENYKKYYLFSGFLILISILSFFLNQKIKFYFITFFFSFLVVLYLSEIYLTFSDHFIKKYKDYKKQTGNEFDKRSKFEVYNDEIKKSNNDVSLTIFPSYYVNTQSKLVPVSGISNSKTIYCNENGYYSIYES